MMNKLYVKIIIMSAVLFILFLYAVSAGIADISLTDVFRSVFFNTDTPAGTIINHIRLPRVILAIVAGAGLAVSGCVFQGILRNPLADPFTLGVSGGAAFGASVGFLAGVTALGRIFLPVTAFAGALCSVFLVYILNVKNSFNSHRMILSGVVASYIFSSAVMLLFAVSSSEQLYSAFMWLMGNLAVSDETLLPAVIIITVIGIAVMSLFGNLINVITLGNEKASSLGINTERTVKYIFLTGSVVTAVIVSCCGVIGFVGMMVPHITRKFVGTNNRVLIPVSSVVGAIFLLLCDTLGRTLFAPVELPVGVITSIVGGLFFVILLVKSSGKMEL